MKRFSCFLALVAMLLAGAVPEGFAKSEPKPKEAKKGKIIKFFIAGDPIPGISIQCYVDDDYVGEIVCGATESNVGGAGNQVVLGVSELEVESKKNKPKVKVLLLGESFSTEAELDFSGDNNFIEVAIELS